MRDQYQATLPYRAVVTEAPSERALFIRRTYNVLAGAILAFMALETFLVQTVPFDQIMRVIAGNGIWGPLLILGAFMLASYVAQVWSRSATSPALQYAGLALYVVVEALIILPLLAFCYYQLGPAEGTQLIGSAGILTLAVFAGLTLTAFTLRKDFSFLAPILWVGVMVSLGVILAGILFGFSLGLFFSFAMVALMAGFILFETSQVMFHYRTDMHVAAALDLFASIATLFYYILRILILLNQRD